MEVLPFNLRIVPQVNGHFQGVKFFGELSPEWALHIYSEAISKESLSSLTNFGEEDLKSRLGGKFNLNPYDYFLDAEGHPTYLLRRINKAGSDLAMQIDESYWHKIQSGEYDSSKPLVYVPYHVSDDHSELWLRDLWLEWMETAYNTLGI